MDLEKLKLQIAVSDEKTFQGMFDHIANGGSLTSLCVMWGLRYSDVMKVIRANKELNEQYKQALADREEWGKERVLSEVRALGTYNLKDVFNPDGTRRTITELPHELTAAIKEVTADGDIKFQDKMKALDTLGKHFGLFTEKVQHSGTVTLEQMIIAATKAKDVK